MLSNLYVEVSEVLSYLLSHAQYKEVVVGNAKKISVKNVYSRQKIVQQLEYRNKI